MGAGVTKVEVLRTTGNEAIMTEGRLRRQLSLVRLTTPDARHLFDDACQRLHYAGACYRVGRRMRLAVIEQGEWVGGVVLGSPFPNLRPRDDAFGLTKYVKDWQERGLASPWAHENRPYWERLQLVVNQARAFVFPQFRGTRVGVRTHALLETEGRGLWEERYGPLAGFDTLCTESRSKLFSENGWTLVGRTLGYRRDPSATLSQRVLAGTLPHVSDNAGLTREPGNTRWWIWVRILRRIR
jgi:hypothetical protein